MRRALREYEVHGIRTTLPFFRWLLDEPDFVAGRFDTTFIDDVLAERARRAVRRRRRPTTKTLAAIAAALQAALSRRRRAAALGGRRAAPSRWRQQARAEALR